MNQLNNCSKMFPKYFLTFFSFALLVAVVSSTQMSYEHEDNNVLNNAVQRSSLEIQDSSVEERNPALVIAIRILQKAFKWAAKHCLKQAASNCRKHWKHPKALIKCGGHFLKANKGRCVVG